jgi:hypothetical protein
MLPGLGSQAALAIAERQGEALRARFAARSDNRADATRLREAAGRITDVESLLKDRRSLRLVLEAFQLESEIDKRVTLRRILTEDPSDRSSLANRLADPRWKALAETFAAKRSVDVPAAALAASPVEDLRKLELSRMAGLDFLQVQALSGEQLSALSPAQIGAIDPEALGGMDADDVTALTRDQVGALSPAQVRGLFLWQVAAIEPTDITALGTAQIRALTPEQLSVLTPEQMGALTPDQVGAFTGAQAGVLDDAQLAALSDDSRALLRAAPFLPDEEPAATRRTPLGDAAVVDRIIESAMTNRFEKAMGADNPGLREALYFRRVAGQVTTLNQLMSDNALLAVTRGALGLPSSFAALDFEQQRDTLARRLDLTKLQDPKEVARMAQRYVAQLNQAGTASPVAALFGGGSANGIAALAGSRVSINL